MKWGHQAQLARVVGITPQQMNSYLKGRKNATPVIAKRIGLLLDQDPFVWLLGGSLEARNAAAEAWEPAQ